MRKRLVLTLSLLALILFSISWLFWKQEVQYWLPTEVPQDYVDIPSGSTVKLDFIKKSQNHKVLHFYNPNCPCSKFNFTSFKNILKNHHEAFDFYLIVQETNEGISANVSEVLEKYGGHIITDQNKNIAKHCGVYSTPQMVILDQNNTLYYKGNYNKARYCTSPNSDYAAMAIDSLFSGVDKPSFPSFAKQAYGCSLEKSTN